MRADWQKRVAGIGLRSAAFTCPRLGAEVRKGRRVILSMPVANWSHDYHEGPQFDLSRREVKATITGVRAGHAFSAVLDPGQIAPSDMMTEDATETDANRIRFLKTRNYWRIVRFLDEPDGAFCELGSLDRDGDCDTREGDCWCARRDLNEQRDAAMRARA